jgi:cell division transport system permease protein
MIAPRRPDDASSWRPAPLLPREPAQDLALVFVTAVLCFFACLALIAALGADRAANGWTRQLQGSATVLVRPGPQESADQAVARAAETLAGTRGVREARALEKEKAYDLIRPWLGPAVELDQLPVPRLVAVELDPARPATAQQLQTALVQAGIDATVDDHSRWMKAILRSGALARIAAIAIAVLTALAAASVMIFATRAGLSARREAVEVLHLAGAQDDYIADLFRDRFAVLGAIAGLMGAAAAAIIGGAARLAGGGHGITPVLPIAWSDLLWVFACPLIAAMVAAFAARLTALKLLGEMP